MERGARRRRVAAAVPVVAAAALSLATALAIGGIDGCACGALLAAALFLRHVANATDAGWLDPHAAELPAPVPDGVVVYDVSGPLRVAAARKAIATLRHVGPPSRAVVLLLDAVETVDATSLVALEGALDEIARQRAVAVLAGLGPQPLAALRDAAILGRPGVLLCSDRAKALRLAARAARGELTPREPALRPANRAG